MKNCPLCKSDVENLTKHYVESHSTSYTPPRYQTQESVLEAVITQKPAPTPKNLILESKNDMLIAFLGDLHIGNRGTDHEAIIQDVIMLSKVPNLKIVLMGDLIDNYIPEAHKGGSNEAILRVKDQKKVAHEIVKILKDKVIGIIQGCHEDWSYEEDDFDFADFLAENTNTAYMGHGGLIRAFVGDFEYDIAVAHRGKGGLSGSFDTLYELRGPVDAMVLAHLHEPYHRSMVRQGRMVHELRCGSYKINDRYAEKLGFLPSIPSIPAILLKAEKRRVYSYIDVKDVLPELGGMSEVSLSFEDIVKRAVEKTPDVKVNEPKPEISRKEPDHNLHTNNGS